MVATQELARGDVLRRFKAAQDEPRHGNNNNRFVGGGDRCLGIVAMYGFFSLACWCLFSFSLVNVCARWFVLFFFDILYEVTALAYLWLALQAGNVYNIEKPWHTTNVSTNTDAKSTSQHKNTAAHTHTHTHTHS